jgi:protein SCO1
MIDERVHYHEKLPPEIEKAMHEEVEQEVAALRKAILKAAFLAGLFVCFGIVLIVSSRMSSPIAEQIAAVGGPFKLIDQNGKTVSDQDLKGHPFLVFFGFTHCPDVCPTTLFDVSEILRALGPDAARTRALFITVDPERDTPAVMKDYLSSFDPHLSGLTGDPADIAAVAKAYRVYYKKVPSEGGNYTMDHTAIVYLMDKDGRFVSPFSLKRPTEAAAADLRRYL